MVSSERDDKVKRIWLYGAGGLVIGGLAWAGFIYPDTVEPDAGMLLGIAELHLGIAQTLPGDNKKAEKFVREHLDKAEKVLDRVERAAPGMPITREYRAFRSWIAGDFKSSMRWYESVFDCKHLDPAIARKTRVNLAQVALELGQVERGFTELGKVEASARDAAWYLAEARAWSVKGDEKARAASLGAGFTAAKGDRKMLRVIADAAFDWREPIALDVYEALPKKSMLVLYRIGRLHAGNGRIEAALSALEQSRKKRPDIFAKLVAADAAFWTPFLAGPLGDVLAKAERAAPRK